jgi:protein AFG1
MPRTITHVYYDPLNEETSAEMDKLFHGLASADPDSDIKINRKLPLWGRELTVPESSGHVARFTFDDLCNHPLSAADYLEITSKFPTVFVEDVPKLTLSERDQARRFITFIDACYENKVGARPAERREAGQRGRWRPNALFPARSRSECS